MDLAGNVRGLRASGGASLGGYRYSAFGQTLEDTTSITQPLRWKARWFSPIAGGTYDVRARQWSPELGIFLSVDEFKYHDPKSTLWGWPGMNPARWRDPTGRDLFGGFGDHFPNRSPEWHRCRNKHNICPAHPPDSCSSERNNGWTFGDGGGDKWRSPLGYECSYDDNGNLKPDVDGNYSFNYEPDPRTARHIWYDVITHFLFGGGAGYDPNLTTVEACE